MTNLPKPGSGTHRLIQPVLGKALYLESPEVTDGVRKCEEWEGNIYPPRGVNDLFNAALCRMEKKESPIQGRGSFVSAGVIEEKEVFGFY